MEMDEERVKQIVEEMTFFNGKKDVSIDELALIQPGLARIMPEIADRTWKLFYCAKEGCWDYAKYQWKEAKKLFELGAMVRPKHEEAIEEYLRDDWSKLEGPIKEKDFEAFPKCTVGKCDMKLSDALIEELATLDWSSLIGVTTRGTPCARDSHTVLWPPWLTSA